MIFRDMLCLGIESTAHTFGIGIVDDKGEVLSNEKDLYTTEEGGLIPFKLGEHHVNVCGEVLKKALEKAHVSLKDIDLISFSQSPGIGNALRVGCDMARAMAILHKKSVVGVNHCVAHLEIGKLKTGMKDPVMLYASGANTQVIALQGGRYRVFGETIDGGIGNFLDSFARELGLGFPGGPLIEQLSLQAQKPLPLSEKQVISLPYVVKGMDVSFGGLFTNLRQKLKSETYLKEDLAFSVQETVFAMLVEVSERAMAHCGKAELLLGGGVGCNKRLQEMCEIMCSERQATFAVPENQFLVDNGAMIAWLGLLEHEGRRDSEKNKGIPLNDIIIKPYLRTDEVDVVWE